MINAQTGVAASRERNIAVIHEGAAILPKQIEPRLADLLILKSLLRRGYQKPSGIETRNATIMTHDDKIERHHRIRASNMAIA